MNRRGLGKGLGCGYKNIAPMDAHIHSLSAKGVVTYRKTKSGKKVRIGINRDGTKNYVFGLDARGSMNTITLDPEYSIIMYADDTRNGFKHVAILMKNGYEVGKASVNYLNRTWESYSFQTVIHKLMDANFDKNKAQILKADIDKKGGRSLMAKGKKMSDKAVKRRFKELDREIDTMTGTSESDEQIKDTLQDVENEQLKLMIDHPQTFGINAEEPEGRKKYKALEKVATKRGLNASGLLKGNKLKKRLQKLGFKTDNTNWDKKSDNDDGERWEE